MNFWERTSRRHPATRGLDAELLLTRAYQAVFHGNPDRSQQQMVLADLANKCGWLKVTAPSGASDRELWFAEGKRAAYSTLFAHLSLSPDDVLALENAARHEAAASSQYDAN